MSAADERKRTPQGPLSRQLAGSVQLLRVAQNLTYTKLSAQLAGLGQPIPVLGLRRIEECKRRVDPDEVAALATVLGVSASELTGRVDGSNGAAKSLANVLDAFARVVESVMDSGRPSDEHHDCPMCCLPATESHEHDPDCGWRIARTRVSPADVAEVRRLARVLRYDGGAA